MFDFLTGTIDNALGALDGILDGEPPSRRQVAKLISDGVTIAAIASTYGVAESVIQAFIDD